MHCLNHDYLTSVYMYTHMDSAYCCIRLAGRRLISLLLHLALVRYDSLDPLSYIGYEQKGNERRCRLLGNFPAKFQTTH